MRSIPSILQLDLERANCAVKELAVRSAKVRDTSQDEMLAADAGKIVRVLENVSSLRTMLSVLLVFAGVACHNEPPRDKQVVSKYIGTKKESQYVYTFNGSGGMVDATVPAFYVVSSDNMVCEVKPRVYQDIRLGHLLSCVWQEEDK